MSHFVWPAVRCLCNLGQLRGAGSLFGGGHVYTKLARIRAELSPQHVSKYEQSVAGAAVCSQAGFFGKAQFLANTFQTATTYSAAPQKCLAVL